MKIYYDEIYNLDSKLMKNKIIIEDDEEIKHSYFFKRNKMEANIISDDIIYIEEACDFYHNDNEDIYKYYNDNNTFYKEFEKPYIFRLPINIIRPLKQYIEKELYDTIDENYEVLNIILPVVLIDDEYFLYDGHKRLKSLAIDNRMVNVYLKDIEINEDLKMVAYINRELNLKTIDDVLILNQDEIGKKFFE